MQRNPRLLAMRCIRCGTEHPFGDHPEGCPACLAQGYPSNLQAVYAPPAQPRLQCDLPYPEPVTLGEGNTPLLPVQLPGGSALLKMESRNPTGSHKDRMAAQILSRAVEAGAREVVAASSGNAGLAVAAYTARAGLRCEIALTVDCPELLQQAMQAHGAVLRHFSRSLDRWPHVRERVLRDGAHTATNYLLPPVGSPPIGVEGYKPIAAELLRDLGKAPDVVFVPTSRGDLVWGIHAGFAELQARGLATHLPRMVVVEPLPRLARVLAGADWRGQFDGDTAQFSTAGSTVTLQAVAALQRSDGRAMVVDDAQARQAQAELARIGVLAELSSASGCAALLQARHEGWLSPEATAVAIITAGGLKDAHAPR